MCAFSSERENIILQWAFKFNNYLAAANTWHLKGAMPKVETLAGNA
jgi:hypothetical protein